MLVDCHFFWGFPVPGDLRERLQAPADMVSVRRGPFGRPALRLSQTRVGADVPAAGVRVLAGWTLGTGGCHCHIRFQLDVRIAEEEKKSFDVKLGLFANWRVCFRMLVDECSCWPNLCF